MNHKRYFLLVLTVLFAVSSVTACGGKEPETFSVGIVSTAPLFAALVEGFQDGLAEAGYIEGENLTYIYDGPLGFEPDVLDEAVQKMVDAEVDLIVSFARRGKTAAQRGRQGSCIHIVFLPLSDPVGAGFVESFRHPGGNITGVSTGGVDAARLDRLIKIAPDVKEVYIPYNENDASPVAALEEVRETASKLGVELVTVAISDEDQVIPAAENIPDNVDAIILLPDSLVVAQFEHFLQASFELQLPLTSPVSGHTQAGALFHYGPQLYAAGAQAARMADQILQGTLPADLPVEISEFFLTINLQTAEAIGLDISDEILEAATEVVR